MLRAVIAWGIAALALLASIVSLTVWAGTPFDIVTFVTLPLAFGGVGAFLTVRVPGNPIGPMLLASDRRVRDAIASGAYVVAFVERAIQRSGRDLSFGLLANLTFIPSLVLVIVGVRCSFRTGGFLPRAGDGLPSCPRSWCWPADAARPWRGTRPNSSPTSRSLRQPVRTSRGFDPPSSAGIARLRSPASRSSRSAIFARAALSPCRRRRAATDQLVRSGSGVLRSAAGRSGISVLPPSRTVRATVEGFAILALNSRSRWPIASDRRRPLSAVRHRPADQPAIA